MGNGAVYQDNIIVGIAAPGKWLFAQMGQLALAVGLISLIFNYGYRALVDWNVSGVWFYATTLALALMVFIAFRRDYIFVRRFVFSTERITVQTLFGSEKTYPTTDYAWIPALHKTVNLPEQSADLSFYIQDIKTKRSIRNYTWTGFSAQDFQRVSRLYGHRGDIDFSQKDFGRR